MLIVGSAVACVRSCCCCCCCKKEAKKVFDGTRIRNLPLRRRMPYPLGHEDITYTHAQTQHIIRTHNKQQTTNNTQHTTHNKQQTTNNTQHTNIQTNYSTHHASHHTTTTTTTTTTTRQHMSTPHIKTPNHSHLTRTIAYHTNHPRTTRHPPLTCVSPHRWVFALNPHADIHEIRTRPTPTYPTHSRITRLFHLVLPAVWFCWITQTACMDERVERWFQLSHTYIYLVVNLFPRVWLLVSSTIRRFIHHRHYA
jgi:hypothetical protein